MEYQNRALFACRQTFERQIMIRKNKFNAKKITIDNITFDSIKEGRYYQKLKLLKKSTDPKFKVLDIEFQPRFDMIVNERKIGFYKADFKVTYPNRVEIVDVKGLKKGSAYQLFRLKKKLVEALYNIEIIEI